MKTFRFLTTLTGLILLMGLSACSKDSDGEDISSNDEYYIKFKVDGQYVVFANDNVYSTVLGTFNIADSDGGQYASGIVASRNTEGSNADTFSILVGTVEETGNGVTYTNYTSNASKTKADTFLGTYGNVNDKLYGTVDETLMDLFENTKADSEITFTEVTENTLKGTFSGTWYDFESDPFPSIKITEGEFYVPRLKNED